jgi:hypothetical protein
MRPQKGLFASVSYFTESFDMPKLLSILDDFPTEREAIGEMVIAYGEIEFALLTCLAGTLSDHSLDLASRILFRVRGEAARIEVADAIIRPAFTKVGLGGKWTNAHGAARHCKNIRNQYAHCHWLPRDNVLTFMDLDQDSKQPEGDIKLTYRAVNVELVVKQREYFEYCLDLLWFLEAKYQKLAGLLHSHDLEEPKPIQPPPRYITDH